MATEFEQLLQEQKLTNKLLTEKAAADAKAPTIARSFRDSLGEIIDNRRTTKKYADEDKKFQKKEGIVKVDDNVAKGTKEVITQSKFFKEQIDSLDDQDQILARMYDNSLFANADIFETKRLLQEMVKQSEGGKDKLISIASSASGIFKDYKGNFEPASKKKANEKKEASNEKKSQGFLKSLNEQFKGISGFLRSNKFVQGVGSFLGKALLLTGLIAFVKFISSPKFIEFARFLDKTIVPVLGKIFDVLTSVGQKAVNLVAKLGANIIDPEQNMMTKFTSAVLLAALGVVAFFSKSIALYVGGLALKGLLALGGLTIGAIFTPIVGIVVAVVAAIAGAIFAGIKAFDKFKESREEGDSIALALTKASGQFIAEFLGLIPNLIIKGIGSLVAVFDKDLGAKIKSFSFSDMIADLLGMLGNVIKTAFQGIFKYFKKVFMGQNAEEIAAEITELETRKSQTDLTPGQIKNIDKQIEKLKEKKIKAEESGGRVGGLGNMLGGGNDVSDQSKIGTGAYRGGRARAGQSIMVGEAGPEFFIPTTDAQVFSARRTEEMIMSALARGMNGGGEGGSTIITSDNSVRSNSSTTNVVNETITPLDTITTSVISSV